MSAARSAIIFLFVAAAFSACHSPTVAQPAAWHRPHREYQAYDSLLVGTVDYALVQRIQVGMTLTEVAQLVGTQPVDYPIDRDYAILCTYIHMQPYEVALRHVGGDTVTAISFRPMHEEKQ
jgi:hypothetical protein